VVDAARRVMERLERFSLELPGAWTDTPWGEERVTKVGAKIFAFWGSDDDPGVTVKLPDSGDHGLRFRGAVPTGYGLGRHGWVTIPLRGVTTGDAEILVDFVEESYRAVAPKKLVRELDAR
jgi:predicted DNA-binding protein (MmcQ/YjbR family)